MSNQSNFFKKHRSDFKLKVTLKYPSKKRVIVEICFAWNSERAIFQLGDSVFDGLKKVFDRSFYWRKLFIPLFLFVRKRMFEFGFTGDLVEDSLLPAELFENLIVIVFISKNSLLFATKKIVSFDGVMLFNSCCHNTMNQCLTPRLNTNASLHSEIPLVVFFGKAHFWIARFILVLCDGCSVD